MDIQIDNLPRSARMDSVVANYAGKAVQVPTANLAALIKGVSGPDYQRHSQLMADLAWPAGVVAAVWGDTELLNGVYKKSGKAGEGAWARIGDLPGFTGDAAMFADQIEQLDDLQESVLQAIHALTVGANGFIFPDRSSGAFALAKSLLTDRTVFWAGGLPYCLDSKALGAASCTNDLGEDGVVPAGFFISPTHYGVHGDGRTDDTTAFLGALARSHVTGVPVYVLTGEYALSLNVTQPNLTVIMASGVVLRAASPGNTLHIQESASGCIITGERWRVSGQTKAQEDAALAKCMAAQSIQVDATDVTLRGVISGAARFDGLYCAINSRRANFRCFDFEFGDSARNGVSVVDGDGYLFERGLIWNDGSHIYEFDDGSGTRVTLHNYALFDHEPNEGQVSRGITIRDVTFRSGTPTGGGQSVLLHDPRDGGINIDAVIERCQFIKAASNPGGHPIVSPANIRTSDITSPTGTKAMSHITVRDCYFEDRVFANAAMHDLSHIHIENVTVGTLNFAYAAKFDETCSFINVTSNTAGALSLPSGEGFEIRNYQGYVPTVRTFSRVIGLEGTALTDILQFGTRAAFEVKVKAAANGRGGCVHSSFSEASVSDDYTENATVRTLHNPANGLDVQWAAKSGYSADARKLQVKPLSASMNRIIVEVTVYSADPGQTTVKWLV